ncbi:MAG: class I SAM-dependent methyltransferase family protein [Candidatus Moranbacteria bacterium]|nr:class I SAM-dependent methyltransferase family protein [Candidatus Moranbacteria bacterium]
MKIQALNDNRFNESKSKYFFIIWLVSFFAMITNSIKILFRKFFVKQYRGKNFKRIWWEMGRDEKHYSSLFIDRFSKTNHYIKVKAASSMALDVVYDWEDRIRKGNTGNNLASKFTNFWFNNIDNQKALNNRRILVTSLLNKTIKEFKNESEIRLISIAAGSARAVISVIKENKDCNIKVILIDKDEEALSNAKINAVKEGIADKFEFICDTAGSIVEVSKNFRPHIVEMVGLMDYFNTEKSIEVCGKIYNSLVEGGYFLTGNVKKNREKIFLDWGLLWPMIYKDEKVFEEIILGAGFSSENVSIFYEPFKIHGVSFSKK